MSDDFESIDAAPDDLERAFQAVTTRPDFSTVVPRPINVSPVQAFHNTKAAVRKLDSKLEQSGQKPSEADRERAAELLLLAQAVVFAHLRVQAPQPPRVVNQKLSRARELRSILLPAARACANAGLLEDAEVAAIEKGRGPVDVAMDLVALAALYRKTWELLENATPATPAMLDEAAGLGSELIAILNVSPEKDRDANDTRDRIWALLNDRYEELWLRAAQLWGSRVATEFPKLSTFRRRRASSAPA
ncbi:MAG: hypothetical protein RBU37_12035 [Myxococcota bacterium]|jgi:hypothetical protein|nr:hypothetical protein [Myxococcota bacterium]